MVAKSFEETYCRIEMINGNEIRMQATPTGKHNFIVRNLSAALYTHFRGKTCHSYGENYEVRFDDNNRVIPDGIILCDKGKDKGNFILGEPDLIIEVLSKSTAHRDLFAKKDMYEKFGVREYWIVNPDDKSVTVYTLDGKVWGGGKYFTVVPELGFSKNEVTDEEIQERYTAVYSGIFPDLSIPLGIVFDDVI